MKKITLLFLLLFSVIGFSQNIVIGAGTGTTAGTGSDPIDGYYNSMRYQVVYTAAELSASLTPYDEITGLGFSIDEDYGGGALLGYTIKMGHTSATNSATHDASITSTVKAAFSYDPTVTAGGVFDMINFDSNFIWNGVDNVLVEICTVGPNPFTSPYGGVRMTTLTNGSRVYRVDSASACGTNTNTANGNRPNIQFNYIDGTPPSCLAPSSLTAGSFTSSSASLSWNENGTATTWNIEWGVSPLTLGAGTTVTGVTNPHLLGSLAANTTYQYYVQSDCGGSQSTWSGPFTFVTPCNAYTVPYFEGFETGYTDAISVAGCLTQASVTGTQTWTANSTATSNNRAPRTGAWNAYLRYSNEDWIFIPIDLVGGTSYTVNLYARQDGATGTNSNMAVSYGTTNNAAGMTLPIVAATNIINGSYQQITGAFTPATTGTYYVGIKGYMNGTPWYISLDDISINVTPACPAPSGIIGANLSDSSIDLSWTATTGNYEYVLDTNATDPTGSGTALAGESFNATLLSPLTTYYFHVRSDCGSTWTTYSFTTLATPPANNNCSAAQVLTPGGVFATNAVVGTNVGATDSGETAPGCASYSGGDVWYQVTVPASGNLTFENNTNTTGITDSAGAVYSGSCGSLVLISCDDSSSAAGDDHPLISVTGRTPGEVLYYRVWEYGNNAFGTFQVSAYDASLSASSFDNANFTAYPNPVIDVLNLEYNSEISSIRVINLLGQEVISKNISANSTKVDMSQLNAGAYIVNVTIGDTVKTIKVVKQ